MDSLILNIAYEALLSYTKSFITIAIPFIGAFWLYKVNNKTVAEAKIFEIGRRIAAILYERPKGFCPSGLSPSSYIDSEIRNSSALTRNEELHKLLQKASSDFFTYANDDEKKFEISELVMAIAAERYFSLVPDGVTWSGKGYCYNSYGVHKTSDDNFFPFGTKIYRDWINNYTYIYNDIWICTGSIMVHQIQEAYNRKTNNIYKKELEEWLVDIKSKNEIINLHHSELVGLLQFIDNNINERQFARGALLSGFYLVLLSMAGIFVPQFLHDLGVLSSFNLSLLIGVSSIASVLIIYRMFFYRNKEYIEKRKLFLPKTIEHLKVVVRSNDMKYDFSYLENILLIREDLKISMVLLKK